MQIGSTSIEQIAENIKTAENSTGIHEHVFEQFPTLQLSVCIRCGCKCPIGCEDEYIND